MAHQKLDFDGVVQAWDAAGEESIHPLWSVDQNRYWESGRHQAQQITQHAKEGARVVDFGCGNGRLTIPLVQLGYDVLAVDSSSTMLDRLEKNAVAAGVAVTSIQSDGSDLAATLGRKKADVIVARAVLIHHDYDGVRRLVTDLAKALKKGGVLIADWPLAPNPGERDTWISVTTWNPATRLAAAADAGLAPVAVSTEPTVWRKE
jgi:2-polyprenyl-3-methyl-5-hydroxy-6-metoxy-1,4-benzoquinol methylase